MTDTTTTTVQRRLPPVLRPTDLLPEDDGPIIIPSQAERRLLEDEIRSWKHGGNLHGETANSRASIAWNDHVEQYATALRPSSPGRSGTFIAGYRDGEATMSERLTDYFLGDQGLGLDELDLGTSFIACLVGKKAEELFVATVNADGADVFLMPETGRTVTEEDIDGDTIRGYLRPPQRQAPVPSY